jgi:hypothetical protein
LIQLRLSKKDCGHGACGIDVGHPAFRGAVRVFYAGHKVYVLRVMTQPEYDREDWPTQCGCFQPLPERTKPDLVGGKRPFTVDQMHVVAKVFGLPRVVFMSHAASA